MTDEEKEMIKDELGLSNVEDFGFIDGEWRVKYKESDWPDNTFDSFASMYDYLRYEGAD